MRRFRLTFVLVAVVLLGAVALLVQRALQTVDVESRIRHEALAERIFDEMERSLSQFIAAEEARGFPEPGTLGQPPQASDGAWQPPFVVGHFQIDPNGRLRVASPAARAVDVEPRAAAREVEEGVRQWRDRSADATRGASLTQEPGSTVRLGGKNELATQALDAGRNVDKDSVYGALRSLNKGVEQRAERQNKVFRSQAPADAGEAETGQALAIPVELSPLSGSRLDAKRFLLVRQASQGARHYRQGLLLDVPRLGEWLEAEAIGSTELAGRARLDFADAGGASSAAAELAFRHRFAAPFESLSAHLRLEPLPGLGGSGYVYALSSLSIAAVLLGLVALYRMGTVVLRYAEQRENFVAAVTHELKTPLAAIRLYGEMLRDGIVPSEAKRDEYHRHITAESERLSRLINNVLEHSRLERGARRVTLESGDLGAAVRDVAVLVRPHVEGAGFTLDLRLDGELPPVRFERDAVMQILFNLVDNAVKYAAGAAAKRIELRCRAEGEAVHLAVRDGGPGVPPSHLGRIFEPFQRAESELTRRTRGTGLGLALVRGLAEAMQARVTGRNLAAGGFEVELEFRRA